MWNLRKFPDQRFRHLRRGVYTHQQTVRLRCAIRSWAGIPEDTKGSLGCQSDDCLRRGAVRNPVRLGMADEPSANMDSELARTIMDLLMDIVRINKATIITCSHDLSLLRPGFRHIKLLDGRIESDSRISKDVLEEIIREYLLIESNRKK